jgi:hypothetical protein
MRFFRGKPFFSAPRRVIPPAVRGSGLFRGLAVVINVRKLYRAAMAVLVSALLLAQLALTTPGARTVLTFIDRFEGGGVADSAGTLAELTLSLIGAEPAPEIEILQNGQPVAVFYDREIKITVSDNSVIEIDGRKIKKPFTVEITAVSPNAALENNTASVAVNSNISRIGRIFIK